jgi:hypothetical protein
MSAFAPLFGDKRTLRIYEYMPSLAAIIKEAG